MTKRQVVVATLAVPEPERDSGAKRLDDMISFLLASGWQVTLVTTRPARAPAAVEGLERRGVAVLHLARGEIAALAARVRFDLALLAFWPTAELLIPLLRRVSPATRVLVDSVDLHFLRLARRIAANAGAAEPLDPGFADQKMGELNTYAAADGVLTVSGREADLINDMLDQPNLALVAPDSEEVEPDGLPFSRRRGVLFVGSFTHAPNIDAAWHLCRNIVPRLPAEVLAAHPVLVVGSGLSDEVRAFADGQPHVHMIGWVPSLAPYYEQARISIVPLLSGAGTKRKLIQALMWGTPSVTTSIGAEGLDLLDQRDVLIADDASDFATAITRLLTDEPLWQALAQHGRQRMIESHSRVLARAAFDAAVEAVLDRSPKGPMLPDGGDDLYRQRLEYQHQQLQTLPGARRD